ncbi:hypothetical protein Nizo2264_0999 [Lactiplantibacillus plantarum]|nr:hypothetical protein Nizo2264_0999 [Lactiplantibacillus plantarum]
MATGYATSRLLDLLAAICADQAGNGVCELWTRARTVTTVF